MGENSYIEKKYIKNYTFYRYSEGLVKIYMNKECDLNDLKNILSIEKLDSLFIVSNGKKKKININEINDIKLNNLNYYFISHHKNK